MKDSIQVIRKPQSTLRHVETDVVLDVSPYDMGAYFINLTVGNGRQSTEYRVLVSSGDTVEDKLNEVRATLEKFGQAIGPLTEAWKEQQRV